MAWRLHDQVVRGEIDNRTRGRVTGRIWIEGWREPLDLALDGDAWRDLAGHRLLFRNPHPQKGPTDGLSVLQEGVVGEITLLLVKVGELIAEVRGVLRDDEESAGEEGA